MKQVKKFSTSYYLGSTKAEYNWCTIKIERRIALSKQTFQKNKNILTNKHIIIEEMHLQKHLPRALFGM